MTETIDNKSVVDYHPRTGTYHASHDMASDRELVGTVVLAVAEAAGVDPVAIDPIYETVDPEALNTLFRPDADGGSHTGELVQLTIHDHTVTVYSDGTIVIRPPEWPPR